MTGEREEEENGTPPRNRPAMGSCFRRNDEGALALRQAQDERERGKKGSRTTPWAA